MRPRTPSPCVDTIRPVDRMFRRERELAAEIEAPMPHFESVESRFRAVKYVGLIVISMLIGLLYVVTPLAAAITAFWHNGFADGTFGLGATCIGMFIVRTILIQTSNANRIRTIGEMKRIPGFKSGERLATYFREYTVLRLGRS